MEYNKTTITSKKKYFFRESFVYARVYVCVVLFLYIHFYIETLFFLLHLLLFLVLLVFMVCCEYSFVFFSTYSPCDDTKLHLLCRRMIVVIILAVGGGDGGVNENSNGIYAYAHM